MRDVLSDSGKFTFSDGAREALHDRELDRAALDHARQHGLEYRDLIADPPARGEDIWRVREVKELFAGRTVLLGRGQEVAALVVRRTLELNIGDDVGVKLLERGNSRALGLAAGAWSLRVGVAFAGLGSQQRKKAASMAKSARAKSPRKRNAKRTAKAVVNPRQLGLFDALDTAPAVAARARRRTVMKTKHSGSEAAPRPVVLSPREAAQYLGVSVSTLKNWRAKKMGPKWAMRGARLVAYRPADLEKFLDDNSAKR